MLSIVVLSTVMLRDVIRDCRGAKFLTKRFPEATLSHTETHNYIFFGSTNCCSALIFGKLFCELLAVMFRVVLL